MVKIISKKNKKVKIAIVASKFNDFITKRLLNGCLEELKNQDVNPKNVTILWVPGSFEIPLTALKLAKRKDIDAVICLGCVIRGETYHFEIVSNSVGQGIMQASLLSGKPVILGVLTTNRIDQAYKRSEKRKNKGQDVARAAVEMIDLLSQI